MKYWKNGFYDEPQEGSVEITEEYYQELLAGQSTGLIIAESKNRHPILVEYEYDIEDDIEELKDMKIAEIKTYDQSDAVNSFMLDGKQIWLDKDTRVGLVNSINVENQAGRLNTVLWFDAVKYTIPISSAFLMLNSLELYALDCYNTTQAHIATVKNLLSKEEVNSYNYKTGYPEKLNFVL